MMRGPDLFHDIVDRAAKTNTHDVVGHVVPDLFFIHQYSLWRRLLELIAHEKRGGFIRFVCVPWAGFFFKREQTRDLVISYFSTCRIGMVYHNWVMNL
jgi:hypothetical protein